MTIQRKNVGDQAEIVVEFTRFNYATNAPESAVPPTSVLCIVHKPGAVDGTEFAVAATRPAPTERPALYVARFPFDIAGTWQGRMVAAMVSLRVIGCAI